MFQVFKKDLIKALSVLKDLGASVVECYIGGNSLYKQLKVRYYDRIKGLGAELSLPIRIISEEYKDNYPTAIKVVESLQYLESLDADYLQLKRKYNGYGGSTSGVLFQAVTLPYSYAFDLLPNSDLLIGKEKFDTLSNILKKAMAFADEKVCNMVFLKGETDSSISISAVSNRCMMIENLPAYVVNPSNLKIWLTFPMIKAILRLMDFENIYMITAWGNGTSSSLSAGSLDIVMKLPFNIGGLPNPLDSAGCKMLAELDVENFNLPDTKAYEHYLQIGNSVSLDDKELSISSAEVEVCSNIRAYIPSDPFKKCLKNINEANFGLTVFKKATNGSGVCMLHSADSKCLISCSLI